MNPREYGNKRFSIVTYMLFIVLNIVIIVLLWKAWFPGSCPSNIIERRMDIASLQQIANGLEAYANHWGYIPFASDDLALKETLYPGYVDIPEIFICKRASSQYKNPQDNNMMLFRYNITLSGKYIYDLNEGDVIVFEPFWPIPPQEGLNYITRKGDGFAVHTSKYIDIILIPIPREYINK